MPFEEQEKQGYAKARNALVDRMAGEGTVFSPSVAAAFRSVPREAFVPPGTPEQVYTDATIPMNGAEGGFLTVSSQPTMMAIMLEQLQAQAGHRVLEIGAGTGYNAALLAHIVGPQGSVDTVEVETEAAAHAAAATEKAGYAARVHAADGANGWPDAAPYDHLISTVAVWDVPPAWSAQMAVGGRIVAPLTILGTEYSAALEREGEAWISRSLEPCAFVRFKGRLAHPDTRIALGDRETPTLILSVEPGQLPERDDVGRWLAEGRGEPLPSFAARGQWDGFVLWLLAHNGPRRALRAVSTGDGLGWKGHAVGLWDADGMALAAASGRFFTFGAGETAAALRAHITAWNAAGRPDVSRFRLLWTPGAGRAAPGVLPRWVHTVRVERVGNLPPDFLPPARTASPTPS